MIMDGDDKRWVIDEIRRQLKIITAGQAGSTTMTTETIDNLMAGHPSIPDRPIMRPYGFASRAPVGTISVTAQMGEHPGNKMTLGHRDKDAPSIEEGESVQYSMGGYRVKVQNGEIFVGKGDDLEHMVVGETLKEFLITLVAALVAHTHIGNLGFSTSPPENAMDFTQAQTDFLDNDKILAKDGGRY